MLAFAFHVHASATGIFLDGKFNGKIEVKKTQKCCEINEENAQKMNNEEYVE